MLLEGQSLKEQGVDVVIGSLNLSNRISNVELTKGIEQIPGKQWTRAESEIFDLDMEALMIRNPEVVLVDELAHRNRPEARYRTRLEEVEQLLKQGISVITTVNAYELEGIQHMAKKLTGIKTSEILPSHVLEMADEVRIVDVTPEKLLSRIENENLDINQEQSVLKKGNIAVLRELALRLVAEGVSESLEKHREEKGYTGPSGAGERILVTAQYHFNGSIYIRRGQQIARRLNGDLRVVTYVNPKLPLSKEEATFKRAMIQLVDKVGGKFQEMPLRPRYGFSDEIVEYALKNGVTRIVLGHSKQSRWQEFRKGSIIREVLRKIRNVDVFLVADRADHDGERILPTKTIGVASEGGYKHLRDTEIVQEKLSHIRRGKFKVYIGAAPGVGKTYTMLREGNDLLKSGIDVQIGLLETHGRIETQAQVGELHLIPTNKIDYRGTKLQEMNTEAILKIAPEVVLVDELAHTNVPGSKLKKRYEDVMELLNAGISVISTMNVQHLESLNDAVEQITGIRVRETVPDSILRLADEVQIVDVAPRTLQKRMQDGKIYAREKVGQALQHFFKEGNLIALRELALRELADDVDERLEAWERKNALRGPWRREEVIHVCIDIKQGADRLIRRGFRIAHRLKAAWYVTYVQLKGAEISKEGVHQLRELETMTERLGGTFRIVSAGNRHEVAEVLIRLANEEKATQMILGQPIHRKRVRLGRGGNIVQYMVRHARHVDVLIVAAYSPIAPSNGKTF